MAKKVLLELYSPMTRPNGTYYVHADIYTYDTVARTIAHEQFDTEDTNYLDYSRPIDEEIDKYCDGFTLVRVFHDGYGGITPETEENSTECNYVPPVGPTCDIGIEVSVVGTTAEAVVTGAHGTVRYSLDANTDQQLNKKFTGLAPGSTHTITAYDEGVSGCKRTSRAFTIAPVLPPDEPGDGDEDVVVVPTGAPHVIHFSQNPIWFSLAGEYVQLELFVEEQHYAGTFRKIVTQRKRPAGGGLIHFRLDTILDRLLQAFVPEPVEAVTTVCTGNVRNYFVRTAELDPETLQPGPFISSPLRTVLRGGVPLELGFNYFTYRQQAQRPLFLTWQPRGKTITPQQPEWLFWLCTAGTPASLTIARRYTQPVQLDEEEGATSLIEEPLVLSGITLNQVVAIPVFPGLVPGAEMVEVWIADDAGRLLSEAWMYRIEPATERSRYFLFSNSLSGVDTLRTEGRLTGTLDVKEEIVEHLVQPGRALSLGYQSVSTQDATRRYKVAVGWQAEQQQHWLQELLLAREAWQQLPGPLLLPLLMSKKALTFQEDDAGLRGYSFDYQYAVPIIAYANPLS